MCTSAFRHYVNVKVGLLKLAHSALNMLQQQVSLSILCVIVWRAEGVPVYTSLDESEFATMGLDVGSGEDLGESTVCLRFRLIWDWRTTEVMRVYVAGGKMMFNVNYKHPEYTFTQHLDHSVMVRVRSVSLRFVKF